MFRLRYSSAAGTALAIASRPRPNYSRRIDEANTYRRHSGNSARPELVQLFLQLISDFVARRTRMGERPDDIDQPSS